MSTRPGSSADQEAPQADGAGGLGLRRLFPSEAGELLEPGDLERLYTPPPGRSVRANFVLSVDGAAEVGGRSAALGGPADRQVFAALRGLADVVLVGSGTVRAENYGRVRLSDPSRRGRELRGQARAVPVAVVTNRAELAPDHRLFAESSAAGEARPLVFTSEAAPPAARRALEDVADVVVCGGAAVDLAEVVEVLAGRGLDAVLCEGGPTILARLAASGLLDELCLTVSPLLAGPGATGLSSGSPFDAPVPLRLVHLLVASDGAMFFRYGVEQKAEAT